VAGILDRLAGGDSIDELVCNFKGRFSRPALVEAINLAAKALILQTKARTLAK
jgi:hypothetical protein